METIIVLALLLATIVFPFLLLRIFAGPIEIIRLKSTHKSTSVKHNPNIERSEMEIREECAMKFGCIKLFLTDNEVALLISCLEWVKLDLILSEKQLGSLDTPLTKIIKDKIPDWYFPYLIPMIDTAKESLCVHSAAHFEEQGKENGTSELMKKYDEISVITQNIRNNRTLVWTGMYEDIIIKSDGQDKTSPN